MSLLKKKSASGVRAGIVLGNEGYSIAVVQRRVGQKPLLQHCSQHDAAAGQSGAALVALAQKLQLGRIKVSGVMNADDYQLVQVEAPEVLPSELRAAVRWRLRDVISFHIDDAVVDVFEIPDQSRRNQAKMMFAAAARSSAVRQLSTAILPAAPKLDVIDIPELCLRNLAALLPQDQRGVALLVIGEQHGQLLLTRQGVLYLARRIDFSRTSSLSLDGSDAVIDASSLALEVQRSLDYYESHFDQTPIGELVIAPSDARAHRLADDLKSETSLRIGLLNPREIMEVGADCDVPVSGACLAAIGAALREDTLQL